MFRNLQDISNHIPKDNLAILKNVRTKLGGGGGGLKDKRHF